jgi:hypothetical protein
MNRGTEGTMQQATAREICNDKRDAAAAAVAILKEFRDASKSKSSIFRAYLLLLIKQQFDI